jgi:hypothetical protein
MFETPEQRGSRLLFAATPKELGRAAVRGAQMRKEAGKVLACLSCGEKLPFAAGTVSTVAVCPACGKAISPVPPSEGPDIKEGIRAHMRKKHGKGKP